MKKSDIYVSDAIGHSSCIDHFFVLAGPEQAIRYVVVLDFSAELTLCFETFLDWSSRFFKARLNYYYFLCPPAQSRGREN